jgi:putative FmdB family regulatory protein
MPIYEYVCEVCGERYERIVLNKAQEIACPKCSSKKSTLRLSVFSAATKGNGGAGPSFSDGGGCCPPSGCGCH